MIITLLSDFGTRDTYVGVMKGVIKGIAPGVEMIDLTHDVAVQDVGAGAFALYSAYRYFPAGTIHLAVVDPGVGGARHPVAAQVGDYFFVCPDNGLLSYILADEVLKQAVVLDRAEYRRPVVSRTFHGRDVFAPAAAHLAAGVPLEGLGTPLGALVTLPLSRPRVSEDAIACHVIDVDVFGNALTDLTEEVFGAWGVSAVRVEVNGRVVPGPLESYSEVARGEPLALFSSGGRLEVAVRDGSARAVLGLGVGDVVTVSRRG